MATLARLLALLAVLLMPLGMSPAAAMESHQEMAGMPMQHCPEQSPTDTGKSGFVECTMACAAALPAADLAHHEPLMIDCAPVRPAAADRLQSLHPETATPPPKRS